MDHLATLLNFVAHRNLSAQPQTVTSYHLIQAEPLLHLLIRLHTTLRCSPCCYAIALIYMDRATRGQSHLVITPNTIHLLFTTSLLIAHQYVDDKPELSSHVARIVGVEPRILSLLKTELLFRLHFSLHVSETELEAYANKLMGPLSTQFLAKSVFWRGLPQPMLPLTTDVDLVPSSPPSSPFSSKHRKVRTIPDPHVRRGLTALISDEM
eukprot:c26919_g1_i1.p1 GENE.c26919_g1_i1~~c26919_g1_i1.p1  ORF type:complete len:210 (+),score=21.38 c26919_g1_i1:117-746(+)